MYASVSMCVCKFYLQNNSSNFDEILYPTVLGYEKAIEFEKTLLVDQFEVTSEHFTCDEN